MSVAKIPSLLLTASFVSNPASNSPIIIFRGATSFAPMEAIPLKTDFTEPKNGSKVFINPDASFVPPKTSVIVLKGDIKVVPTDFNVVNMSPMVVNILPPNPLTESITVSTIVPILLKTLVSPVKKF